MVLIAFWKNVFFCVHLCPHYSSFLGCQCLDGVEHMLEDEFPTPAEVLLGMVVLSAVVFDEEPLLAFFISG